MKTTEVERRRAANERLQAEVKDAEERKELASQVRPFSFPFLFPRPITASNLLLTRVNMPDLLPRTHHPLVGLRAS